MLFARLLRHIVSVGRLRVIDAGGKEHVISGSPGNSLTIRLHDPALHWKLFFNPGLYLGEAYMDGTLRIDQGDIQVLGVVPRVHEDDDQPQALPIPEIAFDHDLPGLHVEIDMQYTTTTLL